MHLELHACSPMISSSSETIVVDSLPQALRPVKVEVESNSCSRQDFQVIGYANPLDRHHMVKGFGDPMRVLPHVFMEKIAWLL